MTRYLANPDEHPFPRLFRTTHEERMRVFPDTRKRDASHNAYAEQEGCSADRDITTIPDPQLVRQIIRNRQLRTRFFDDDLFADPAWDILLDLTAARAEHTQVSVSSVCIASGVPPTTALRWIAQMTEVGLLSRASDETDRRRAFITLTDRAADAMARYFAELGMEAVRLI